MQDLIAIQRWLYEGMASGLSDVAGGSSLALVIAMATAVLFGVLHAMMPGHGKTVLFSYHLGQKDSLLSSIINGTILALTHVGIAIVLVLAGFAVISKVFAYGGRTPQFEAASGVLIVLIGAYLLWRAAGRAAAGSIDEEPANKGRTLAFSAGLVPCPLTTFIMSYALARGLLAAGLVVTAAMAFGMVLTISAVAVSATVSRERLLVFFSRSEGIRHWLGRMLEVGGAVLVLMFGVFLILGAQPA